MDEMVGCRYISVPPLHLHGYQGRKRQIYYNHPHFGKEHQFSQIQEYDNGFDDGFVVKA